MHFYHRLYEESYVFVVLASKHSVSSVAFPSIGTGNLRFPNITAEVMEMKFNRFFASIVHHPYLYCSYTHTKAFQTATKLPDYQQCICSSRSKAELTYTSIRKRVKPKSYSKPPVVSGTDCTLLFGRLRVNNTRGYIGPRHRHNFSPYKPYHKTCWPGCSRSNSTQRWT